MTSAPAVARDMGRAVLRATASVHVLALMSQIGLAMLVVGGEAQLYAAHRSNAWAVLALGVLQGLGVLALARSRLSLVFLSIATLTPALEVLQIWLGRTAQTPWHVTNGMLIWAGALAMLIRLWRPDGLAAPKAAAA
jgi:hypothetical protein